MIILKKRKKKRKNYKKLIKKLDNKNFCKPIFPRAQPDSKDEPVLFM
jgi:uncharacterized protein YebE (UPF0316 family)